MSTTSTNTKRLYIGNLDETIDEYAIVKLFEPFGKITFIEVMVHWVGPKKGLPRGFCFLEYEKKEQALKAINALHGKVIKGKSLVVSFAHMTPEQDEAKKQHQKRGGGGRPNSLSILRGGQKLKTSTTDAKIQAIERKLLLLQKNNNGTTVGASEQSNQSNQHKSSTSNNTSKSTTSSSNRYKPY